jgi:hypothetical protein
MSVTPTDADHPSASSPCPLCGLSPGDDDRGDEKTPEYCSGCTMVICPFCRSTDDCEHVVGFNWGGDFAYTSIDTHFSGLEELQALGFDESWKLVDRLVETCPDPITTVEFFNPGGFLSRWHFAPNGAAIRASFDDHVRLMKDESRQDQNEDE